MDGLGTRQCLYVAMSRAWRANYAYCVAGFPRYADTTPGSRPAPELARSRRQAQEAAGRRPIPPDPETERASDDPARTELGEHRDPVAVLADMLHRDGATVSATETLRAALSDADHLGVLGPIWYDLTRREQAARFEAALRHALPEPLAAEALADRACTWLWRSLRQAEATGLDGADVLRQAIAARSLTGARDIAPVLDSRVRQAIKHRSPAVRASWQDQVPVTGDPGLDRYLAELAATMDGRASRIGEHAARTQPAWAILSLGQPPPDPENRTTWQQRAAVIGAYRELYGYDSLTDAIGPAPGMTSPEAWADWHTAFAALDKIGGIDLRGVSDGQLRLRRASYERELAWAPPCVAGELRHARLQARTAWENAIRAEHAERTTPDPDAASRHRELARAWHALHAKATAIATTLTDADETRRQWAALTEPTRNMALAADLELRRRHPDAPLKPLQTTEPATVSRSPASVSAPSNPQAEQDAAATAAASRLPDLEAADISPGVADHIARIAQRARQAQQQIDKLANLPSFTDEAQTVYAGPAWDVLARRQRDAIIQPPKPEIRPSRLVLQRVQERDAEPELEPG